MNAIKNTIAKIVNSKATAAKKTKNAKKAEVKAIALTKVAVKKAANTSAILAAVTKAPKVVKNVKTVVAVPKAPTLKIAISPVVSLTQRQVDLLKTLATSAFRKTEAKTSMVPTYTLPLEVPASIDPIAIPGRVVSLIRKDLVTTERVKGQCMVSLTKQGVAAIAKAEKVLAAA